MWHLVNTEHGFKLINNAKEVLMDFMLKQTASDSYKVRLEWCDFWSTLVRYCNVDQWYETMLHILPWLCPLLLSNMRYSEYDYFGMESIADNNMSEKDH